MIPAETLVDADDVVGVVSEDVVDDSDNANVLSGFDAEIFFKGA